MSDFNAKYTKFRWGPASDPAGELTALPRRHSALEVIFNVMRSINPRLLTYLLTYIAVIKKAYF